MLSIRNVQLVATPLALTYITFLHYKQPFARSSQILETYNKIVEVREEGEGVWGGDIDVGRLGELRALSICSYALLNKRS